MSGLQMTRMVRRRRRARNWAQPVAALGLICAAASLSAAQDMDRTGTLWAPCLEWSLDNPTWAGNSFDLVATVTFVHPSSRMTHVTEMFYDGGNTWRFRFTGTRTGVWTFTTSSADSDLDGWSGEVTLYPNPDPRVRGLLTSQGNKFVRQVGAGGELEAYRLNVYMNRVVFDSHVAGGDWANPEAVAAYLQDAAQCGFDCIFLSVYNSWFSFGASAWDEHDSEDPDPQTFAVLEHVITTAHARGARVQLWAWGDEYRKWTPIGVGGINGVPDKRLQRYIAARLGPLPGWTMGYGFDLQEWASEEQLREWAEYMHAHFGWQHLLWGRGRSNPELDAVSYSGSGPDSYQDVVADLDSDLERPHLYEERFSYMRWGKYDMDTTRRHLWWYTMAGGMGSWWGFYDDSPYPYPNPEQLRTCGEFWANRFLVDMQRANGLTDGYCLKTADNARYIFYKEDATSIQMDLSGMPGPQTAVAVDTQADYLELALGQLAAETQTWDAPYSSDWAIAVGDFAPPPDDTPPTIVSVTAGGDPHRVTVVFSEPVTEESAQAVANYEIDHDVIVDAAVLDPDTTTVVLTTSHLSPGIVYTLTVNDVVDRSAEANPIAPDTREQFTYSIRVADGLVVVYDFAEGAGTTVHDVSKIDPPLDLELADLQGVEWLDGGLLVSASTIAASAEAATKMVNACTAADEITIEAWIAPADTSQSGPARIVTLSVDPDSRNFTLGQHAAVYDVRLRTTQTSDNGIPSLATPAGAVTARLTHVVYTRAASGAATIYIDAVVRAAGTIAGDLSNWDDQQRFALANEFTMDHPWRGEYRLVAVYNRALAAEEVAQNFLAGPDAQPTWLLGDLNCDGRLDGFDVDAFVLALLTEAGYYALHPDCNRNLADIDGDGRIDGFDIDPFTKLLIGE